MDMEQYFEDAMVEDDSARDTKLSFDKWNSVSDAMKDLDKKSSGGFDCNICLDSLNDPVVTLCGHLYCWPCIYKWLHFQSVSSQNQDQNPRKCPVCKAEVSQASLVPLYGKGETIKSCKSKAPSLGIVIPRRPVGPACVFDSPRTTSNNTTSRHITQQLHYRNYPHDQSNLNYTHSDGYTTSPMISPGRTTTVGVYVEMIYARVFGNSIRNLYTYPNSYNVAGSSSPRLRRHVMQADRSLNRICIFLFCCLVSCLFFF